MLRCFDPSVDGRELDREPFKFHHQLMGYPALELEYLAKVIPSLPAEYVKYSKGLMRNGDDFENCNVLHRSQLSLAETIERMRTSDSYVMVRSPQIHESFQPVFRDLSGDVELLLRRTFGQRDRLLIKPQLYLFIASHRIAWQPHALSHRPQLDDAAAVPRQQAGGAVPAVGAAGGE